MLYLICWSLVAVLLGLWSLAVWGLHAALPWAVSQVGSLSRLPEDPGWPQALYAWLLSWLPVSPAEPAQWLEGLVSMAGPWLGAWWSVGDGMGGGALAVMAWTLWALGAVLIVLMGSGLHLALLVWRRWSLASPAVLPAR